MKYFWCAIATALITILIGAGTVFGDLKAEVGWYMAYVGMPIGILAFLVFTVMFMVVYDEE